MGSDPRVAAYETARAVWTKAWDEDWDLDASFKATCDAFLAALLADPDVYLALLLALDESPDLADRVLRVLSGFSQNRSET